ncbi:hypothetical protein ACFQHV_19100 [Promicromonospora thailandica]|uniref:Uncharacterized protein n=1 Tax=Promicromonospora thailandica TaxID=765201 RepID=A0A9X2JUC6_9MICO|nr:hypothetical protein [Promicromonospora thailandica]MCP2262893.1 hypothetical protein [Promicromonospora thailandica]BFF18240.1 hypothetical protein GCM10025730_17610 [Promicromonospora thailandica]
MPEQTSGQPGNQVPRLVVTWLVVTVPLAYGLFETIRGVIPLFTS